MSTEVTLPALGESVTEGTVSRWLKEVGESVEVDEPLLEVSTDKVDTEIPSPVAGTLIEIRVGEDEVAAVGAVLGVIGAADEAAPAESAAEVPSEPSEPAAEAQPQEVAKPSQPSTEKPVPPQIDSEEEPEAETPPSEPSAVATPADATEVTLPALGESVTEGTVSRWLKEVGEEVELDEPLLEVSTDKVDTEIPSPAAGVLLEIRVHEDAVAQVGAVLGLVGTPSDEPAAPAALAAAGAPEPQAEAQAEPAADAPAAPAEARRAATTDPESGYVTPLVRRMAADAGVDLAAVTGTGVGGRIRKQDVIAAAEAAKAEAEAAAKAAEQAKEAPAPAAAPAAPASAAAAPTAAPAVDASRGKTEKMSRLRQVVASRMTESLQTSAQLTATVEVDMTAISRLRNQVKDDFRAREGTGLTYLAFITKAVTEALKQFGKVNASIDTEAGTVTYHAAEHIGIAVDTDRGLLVPVIKDAGDLNIGGIAKKITDLANRTRDNKVTPDELGGGTFTITNYGSTGTLFDTPIINQPQVAILGTGALVKRPVVVVDDYGQELIAVRDMMYLSLTYDHRLVDGADASRFLAALKARLEEGDFGAEFGAQTTGR